MKAITQVRPPFDVEIYAKCCIYGEGCPTPPPVEIRGIAHQLAPYQFGIEFALDPSKQYACMSTNDAPTRQASGWSEVKHEPPLPVPEPSQEVTAFFGIVCLLLAAAVRRWVR